MVGGWARADGCNTSQGREWRNCRGDTGAAAFTEGVSLHHRRSPGSADDGRHSPRSAMAHARAGYPSRGRSLSGL